MELDEQPIKHKFKYRSGGNIMSRYGISVREILKRTVIVEAENLEEAIQKVENAVDREEIILDVDDYDDREIIPSEYFEGGNRFRILMEEVVFIWRK